MSIKSRAYNQIARFFHPKDELSKISDKEKLERIETFIKESRYELINYKDKRKQKARIEKLRQERGYKPHKRTSKAQYEAMKSKEATVA